MIQAFTPKPKDEKTISLYPSGNIQEEKHMRNGIPANGWSRKVFHENGAVHLAECYSHSLIIEQLFCDEAGILLAHKIYSHKQKQLIDKPKQTMVERPNVVTGYGHMGFYFKHLPAISKFIEAEYDEAALEKAYHDFITTPVPDELDGSEVHWGITGKEMRFSLWFERLEGYYQWHLWAKDETGYEKARHFMESLV